MNSFFTLRRAKPPWTGLFRAARYADIRRLARAIRDGDRGGLEYWLPRNNFRRCNFF